MGTAPNNRSIRPLYRQIGDYKLKKNGKFSQPQKQKNRKRIVIPSGLFLIGTLAYYEVLLHLWTNTGIDVQRLLVVATFGLCAGALLAFLDGLLPAKAGKWVAVGIAVVLAVLYVAELLINEYFQNFMPLSMMLAGGAGVAGTFMHEVFKLIFSHILHIAAVLLPIIAFAVWADCGKVGWQLRIALLGAVAGLYGIGVMLVCTVGGYATGLIGAPDFDSTVRNFGLSIALPLEIYETVTGAERGPQFEMEFEIVEEATEATEAPTVPPATDPLSTGPEEETEPPTEPPAEPQPHVLPLDFAALAEDEPYGTIAKMHRYVDSLTPSMENDYTGLFEGKNLILITAEAFTGEFINPELTPALYRMMTEGIYFTDYYQPGWGAGTTGGEFSNVVGMMPYGGKCMEESYQQDLFLTIGNQLQEAGYRSAAYHNNSYTYYSRHLTHKKLGYDEFIGYGNGMEKGVKKQWPQSDLEMFSYIIPQWVDSEEPFSLYFMTVSGHSSYKFNEHAVAKRYRDQVADLPYYDAVKCYIAANLDFEASMAFLIEALEEAGIADDTVVVISSDHYPYGLNAANLNNYFGEDTTSEMVRDQNQLIIWSGCLEDQDIVVDTPVYSLDVLPTLSNLFGVEYDSRLLPGRDVFSDAEPLVFWTDYSWKTDKGSYNNGTRTFTPNEGVEVDESYVKNVSARVRNIYTYCRTVQQSDYFNYVSKALANVQTD